MKVLHIIPATMNYFDDIKMASFDIVQKLHEYGVDGDVITLQYDQPKQEVIEEISGNKEKKIKGIAKSFSYKSSIYLHEALDLMNNYDLVHFHIPFMGAGKIILQKLNQKKSPPLVVSYYRSVKIVDALSIIISLYSQYYVNKLFKKAKAVILFPQTCGEDVITKTSENKLMDISINENDQKKKRLDEDGIIEIKLNDEMHINISIDKLICVYKTIINNSK